MNLQTHIPFRKAEQQMNYHSRVLLLGSCFSENIGEKLKRLQFRTVQNPFGILFHPLAIENVIQRGVQQREYDEEAVFQLNEQWHCFDAHSSLSASSKQQVIAQLNNALMIMHKQLVASSHIKRLLSVQEITHSLENILEQIQGVNKEAQVIFTLSPVRHLKDGFVENQCSKAHLITAVHQTISNNNHKAAYFESYELMMDELRDYRFYKEDMMHPNALAINYIWEKFYEVWIADDAKETVKRVEEIQRDLQHRSFNPSSEQHQRFIKLLHEKISYIKNEYPFMEFKADKR